MRGWLARALPTAVLAASVACAPAGGSLGVQNQGNVVSFPPGSRKPAPSFSGESLRSGPVIASTLLSGAVAVVHFWGSWCGPCRKEEPIFEAVSSDYAARGVHFVGVDVRRDQKTAALAFWDEFGVTYPSIYNPDSTIADLFRVRFMPSTFVIDRNGAIAAQIIGAVTSRAQITTLLDRELT